MAGIFQPRVFQPRVFQVDDAITVGGIGHYLWEIERARQLAAITKKTPGLPIDRRTTPRFEPLRGSPVAPPAPAVDMAAMQNERVAAAAAARRRRNDEALLLLVG